ncbi:MAG: hypothetical protein GY826_25050, partial [Fuerstiella sp.]|nr:hypothetical protein [Fuerstiella sp.]
MKHSFACLTIFLLVCIPRPATAIEEVESFALLIRTLNAADDPGVRIALMRGMLSGLEGRHNIAAPVGWNALSTTLAQSDNETIRDLSTQLSQIFGDREAMQRALAVLKDTSASASSRRTALRSLLTQRNEEASSFLELLLDETELQLDAIRGYATFENATAPSILLERYPKMSPELQRAVVETLATR